MIRACVIGWPIEHSRSPVIHGYWLRRYGIDGEYTRQAVRPESAAQFLRSLRLRGLAGCNVTIPLKEIAFATADVREPSAAAVGAANTIWLQDGRIHAANTDTYGFMANLAAQVPHWLRPHRPVSILGAGGAARAIVHGFLEAGVSEVRVFNRTRARADELAHVFGPRVVALDWEHRGSGSAASSVVVNTTAAGLKGQSPLDLEMAALADDCVVADIVYVPLETAFLAAARARGLLTVDGLGMLLHQAVPGFEKWFGVRPEVTDELRRLLVADIAGG